MTLRELAEAATPGPWQGCPNLRGVCDCDYRGDVWAITADVVVAHMGPCQCHDDANCDARMVPLPDREQGWANGRFIAACSPDVILALLSGHAALAARVEALEGALATIAEQGCAASRWHDEDPPVPDRCLDPDFCEHEPDRPCDPCFARAALAPVQPASTEVVG